MGVIFKYFIPVGLDVVASYRAKTLLSVLLLTISICIVCFPIQSITSSQFPFFPLIFVMIGLLIVFKFTRSVSIVSNLSCLVIFVAFARLSLISGAPYSLDLMSLYLVVLLSLATNGIRSVIFWLIVCFCWVIYVFTYYSNPDQLVHFRNTMDSFPIFYFLMFNLIFLFVPFILMYILSRLNAQLVADIKKNNEELNLINIDLKKQKSNLSTANKKLEKSNQRLERFAYAVSHDLKQPLQTVISYSNLLKKKLNSFKDSGDKNLNLFVNQIEISSLRMGEQIKEILSFSVQDGDQIHKLSDMNIVLQSVMNDLELLISKSNTKIKASNLPSINIVPGTLYPVFQNLITNSIKYKKPETDLVIEIKSNEFKDRFEFQFKDNGIGIDQTDQNSIFELFKQVDSNYEGSGIGLYTCKQIVESYGGKIWLSSSLQQGSTFYFTLLKSRLRK